MAAYLSLRTLLFQTATELIRTNVGTYDVETLVYLRHFAAHGQASVRRVSLPDLDLEYPWTSAGRSNSRWAGEEVVERPAGRGRISAINWAEANVIAFRGLAGLQDVEAF